MTRFRRFDSKALLLAGLLALSGSWGCAATPILSGRAPQPEVLNAQASSPDRVFQYQRQRVQYLQGPIACVNGQFYSEKQMRRYYWNSKMDEAFDLQSDAIHDEIRGAIFNGVLPAAVLVASLALTQDDPDAQSESVPIAVGAALVLGTIFDIGEHFSAKRDRKKAAESFNLGLIQSLGLRPAGLDLNLHY
jgi:hypothetical protein